MSNIFLNESLNQAVIDNNAVSPIVRKLVEANSTIESLYELAERNKINKQYTLEGFENEGTITSMKDADSGWMVDSSGKLVQFRVTSVNGIDAVDLENDRNRSFAKLRVQPKAVAKITGKSENELTEQDYENVANYQYQESQKMFRPYATPFEKYDPNVKYKPEGSNNLNHKVRYRIAGTDKNGRLLVELLNPETGRNIGKDMSDNPYLNARFDLYKTIDSARNRQALQLYDVYHSANIRKIGEAVDNDGRIGEDFDILQSEAYRIGARFLNNIPYLTNNVISKDTLESIGIDTEKWKAIADPRTGKEIADIWAGVKQDTRDQFNASQEHALQALNNGEYVEAFTTITANLDRFLAESAPQMALLSATKVNAIAGIMGLLAAGLDKTLSDIEDYRVTNNRDMSKSEALLTYIGATATLIPEAILTASGLNKLFNPIMDAYKKGGIEAVRRMSFTAELGKGFSYGVKTGLGELAQEATEEIWDEMASGKDTKKQGIYRWFDPENWKQNVDKNQVVFAGMTGFAMGGALGHASHTGGTIAGIATGVGDYAINVRDNTHNLNGKPLDISDKEKATNETTVQSLVDDANKVLNSLDNNNNLNTEDLTAAKESLDIIRETIDDLRTSDGFNEQFTKAQASKLDEIETALNRKAANTLVSYVKSLRETNELLDTNNATLDEYKSDELLQDEQDISKLESIIDRLNTVKDADLARIRELASSLFDLDLNNSSDEEIENAIAETAKIWCEEDNINIKGAYGSNVDEAKKQEIKDTYKKLYLQRAELIAKILNYKITKEFNDRVDRDLAYVSNEVRNSPIGYHSYIAQIAVADKRINKITKQLRNSNLSKEERSKLQAKKDNYEQLKARTHFRLISLSQHLQNNASSFLTGMADALKYGAKGTIKLKYAEGSSTTTLTFKTNKKHFLFSNTGVNEVFNAFITESIEAVKGSVLSSSEKKARLAELNKLQKEWQALKEEYGFQLNKDGNLTDTARETVTDIAKGVWIKFAEGLPLGKGGAIINPHSKNTWNRILNEIRAIPNMHIAQQVAKQILDSNTYGKRREIAVKAARFVIEEFNRQQVQKKRESRKEQKAQKATQRKAVASAQVEQATETITNAINNPTEVSTEEVEVAKTNLESGLSTLDELQKNELQDDPDVYREVEKAQQTIEQVDKAKESITASNDVPVITKAVNTIDNTANGQSDVTSVTNNIEVRKVLNDALEALKQGTLSNDEIESFFNYLSKNAYLYKDSTQYTEVLEAFSKAVSNTETIEIDNTIPSSKVETSVDINTRLEQDLTSILDNKASTDTIESAKDTSVYKKLADTLTDSTTKLLSLINTAYTLFGKFINKAESSLKASYRNVFISKYVQGEQSILRQKLDMFASYANKHVSLSKLHDIFVLDLDTDINILNELKSNGRLSEEQVKSIDTILNEAMALNETLKSHYNKFTEPYLQDVINTVNNAKSKDELTIAYKELNNTFKQLLRYPPNSHSIDALEYVRKNLTNVKLLGEHTSDFRSIDALIQAKNKANGKLVDTVQQTKFVRKLQSFNHRDIITWLFKSEDEQGRTYLQEKLNLIKKQLDELQAEAEYNNLYNDTNVRTYFDKKYKMFNKIQSVFNNTWIEGTTTNVLDYLTFRASQLSNADFDYDSKEFNQYISQLQSELGTNGTVSTVLNRLRTLYSVSDTDGYSIDTDIQKFFIRVLNETAKEVISAFKSAEAIKKSELRKFLMPKKTVNDKGESTSLANNSGFNIFDYIKLKSPACLISSDADIQPLLNTKVSDIIRSDIDHNSKSATIGDFLNTVFYISNGIDALSNYGEEKDKNWNKVSAYKRILYSKAEKGDGYVVNKRVAATILYSLFEYLNQSDISALFCPFTKDDLSSFTQGETLSSKEVAILRKTVVKYGFFRDSIANNLGDAILKNLGISSNKDSKDDLFINKLSIGLGEMAIVLGENLGFFQFSTLDRDQAIASMGEGAEEVLTQHIHSKSVECVKLRFSSNVNYNYRDNSLGNIQKLPKLTLNAVKSIKDTTRDVFLGKIDPTSKEHVGGLYHDYNNSLISTSVAEPSFTPSKVNPNMSVRYSNGLGKVPTATIAVIDKLQHTPYRINTEITDFLVENESEVLHTLGCYTDAEIEAMSDLTYEDKITLIGQSQALRTEFDNLIRYAELQKQRDLNKKENEELAAIYFKYFVGGNYRLYCDSATLNPQSGKKISRFLCMPVDTETIFDKSNADHINEESYAICQAFDMLGENSEITERADEVRSLTKEQLKELKDIVIGKATIEDHKDTSNTAITSFRDRFHFLSNMFQTPVTYEGITYPSVEHAFQAAKTLDVAMRKRIAQLSTPKYAKQVGRKIALRNDWEDVKLGIMKELVRSKFNSNPTLKELLLNTGSGELVEGNNWNDTYWGVSKGKGENHLGKILMEVRSELRPSSPKRPMTFADFKQKHNLKFKYGVENFGQVLNVIQHLERRLDSKSDTFKSWLAVENDGTTSGFFVRMLQYPIDAIIDKYGEQVGIIKPTSTRYGKTIHELKKGDKEFHDIYETTALNVANVLAKMDIKTKFKSELSSAIFEKYLLPLLPKAENGVVSKALRNLMKDPTMIFGYSAGKTSIINNIAKIIQTEVLSDFLKDVSKYGVNDLVKIIKDADKSTLEHAKEYSTLSDEDKKRIESRVKLLACFADTQSVNGLNAFIEAIKTKEQYLIKGGDIKQGAFKLLSLDEYFRTLVTPVYGEAIWEALDSSFAAFQPYIESTANMFNDIAAMSSEIINKELNKIAAKNNGIITTEQKRKVLDKCRGIMPLLKLPYGNGLDIADQIAESMLIFKQVKAVHREGSSTLTTNDNDTSLRTLVNYFVPKVLSQDGKLKNNDRTKKATNAYYYQMKSELGRSGAVIPIHTIDGIMMALTMASHTGIPVHDAVAMSAIGNSKVTNAYNRLGFELGNSFDMFSTLIDTYKSVISTYADQISKEDMLLKIKSRNSRSYVLSDTFASLALEESNLLGSNAELYVNAIISRYSADKKTVYTKNSLISAFENGISDNRPNLRLTTLHDQHLQNRRNFYSADKEYYIGNMDGYDSESLFHAKGTDSLDTRAIESLVTHTLSLRAKQNKTKNKPVTQSTNSQIEANSELADVDVNIKGAYGIALDLLKGNTEKYISEILTDAANNGKLYRDANSTVEGRIKMLNYFRAEDIANGKLRVDVNFHEHLAKLISLMPDDNVKNYILLYSLGRFNNGVTKTTSNGSIIHISKDDHSSISSDLRLSPLSGKSLEEIYAHELTHANVEWVLNVAKEQSDYYNELKQLTRLWRISKRILTPEDFLPEGITKTSSNYSAYMSNATKLYDYMFYNFEASSKGLPNTLAEFLAHALTNAKIQRKLSDKSTRQYLKNEKYKSIGQKILAIFKFLAKSLIGKAKFSEGFSELIRGERNLKITDSVYAETEKLYFRITNINGKAHNRILQSISMPYVLLGSLLHNALRIGNGMITPLIHELKDFIENRGIKLEYKHLGKDAAYLGTTSLAVSMAKALALWPVSRQARDATKAFFTQFLNVSNQNLLMDIVNQCSEKDVQTLRFQELNAQTRLVEQSSKGIESIVANNIIDAFTEELTEEQQNVLTTVFLRTNLQCLLHSNVINSNTDTNNYDFKEGLVSKVLDYIANDTKRTEAISKLRNDLESLLSKRPYNKNLLYSLINAQARYMATGKGNTAVMLNTYNIMDYVFSLKDDIGHKVDILDNENKITDIITKLISLNALSYIDKDSKIIASNMEKEGIANFLRIHSQFVYESYKGINSDNEIYENELGPNNVIMGYTKSLLNQDLNIEIATKNSSRAKQLEAEGYVAINEVQLENDYVFNKNNLVLYRRAWAVQEHRDGAGFIFAPAYAAGRTITKSVFDMLGNTRAEPSEVEYRFKQYFTKANTARLALFKSMMSKEYTDKDFDKIECNYIPLFDKKGDIVDYRINYSHEIKDKFLSNDISGISVLSKMFATQNTRLKTSSRNKALLDFLVKDANEHMDSDSHLYVEDKLGDRNRLQNLAIKYIDLGNPTTNNKYLKESERLFPREVKEYIKKHGSLWVREDWLLGLFGSPTKSLTQIRLVEGLAKKLPKTKYYVAIAENIIKSLAFLFKNNIVIKIPIVLVNNIISNTVYSIMQGRDPIEVINRTMRNVRATRDYIEDKKKYERIQFNKRLGTVTKEELHTEAGLLTRMNNNPVYPLIKQGMFQAIVEDMKLSDIQSESSLLKKMNENKLFQKVNNKTPNMVKQGLRALYLTKGTTYYDFMFTATQYSDFVARATEYQMAMKNAPTDLTERKQYEEAVFHNIRQAFINYDTPQSGWLQYANDMGLAMFTKYAFRIQSVITKQALTNPLGVIIHLLTQATIMPTEDILDSFYLNKSWSRLLHIPTDFATVAVPMPIQWVTGMSSFL